LIGAGVNVQITPAVDTYVDYDGDIGGQNYQSHSINGGVRVKF
jgi:outer membrane autotransporter protein